MPGMFGGVHAQTSVLDELARAFQSTLRGTRSISAGNGILGAHSHGPKMPVGLWRTASGSSLVAVDGDRALYRAFETAEQEVAEKSLTTSHIAGRLQRLGVGNVAIVDADLPRLVLSTDWSGTFPLYFAATPEGVLFSSHIRPLACVLPSAHDLVGITEYLRTGYTYAGRTPFKRIKRLLPGQVLELRVGEGVHLTESSRAWAGKDPSLSDIGSAGEATWGALAEAVARDHSAANRVGVMMSAGWDSRTLLALEVAAGGSTHVEAYSHGDIRSRELRLARSLSLEAGTRIRLEPIDDRVLDPNLIDEGFRSCETLVFPHWHRAGRLLAGIGVERVSAGVFGEILGGHYGLTMLTSGMGKARALLASLHHDDAKKTSLDAAFPKVRDLLLVDSVGARWYLDPDFEAQLIESNVVAEINADIEADLKRLVDRGVNTGTQLLEAFVSEHRGSQYINAQLLSVRSSLDVSLPFAASQVMEVTTRIPAHVKVHNLVNQSMLRHHWPQSLRYPMAATLVPADAPLLIQESSRLVRKIGEAAGWSLHFLTRGYAPHPRLGWVDFEFLRTSDAFAALGDRFTLPMWNQGGIRGAIESMRDPGQKRPTHPMFDQMGKMLTLQGWLG